MHIDLSGRTALVTGSTAGIGLATAEGLAAAGAEVVVNGRTRERVDAAVAHVGERVQGAKVRGVAADVGSAEGAAALIEAAPDVDVLVSNTGLFGPTPVFEITDDDWRRFFEVNVLAGIRLARHHLPRTVRAGWGRAVFVSSESALNIPTDMIHYGMTKTAVLAVARGLAQEVAGTGVTVNSVLPGPTRTEGVTAMLAEAARPGEDIEETGRRFVAENRPSSLLGRLARPEEVASMIVYVCSEQASATSGAALRADGGVVPTAVP